MNDKNRSLGAKGPTAGQVKNVREAIDSIVRGLHLLNGGGAVALLAFLGSTWTAQPEFRRPILVALSILAFGEVIVGISTYVRMKWLEKELGKPERDYSPPKHYEVVLVMAFVCFVAAISFLIVSLFQIIQ